MTSIFTRFTEMFWQNDLSPVSHKTRGPFLGIPFNLSATPSTSFNSQSIVLCWFSSPLVSLYPPSLPALTPEQHEVLKDFLPGWLACLSCSLLLWLPFIVKISSTLQCGSPISSPSPAWLLEGACPWACWIVAFISSLLTTLLWGFLFPDRVSIPYSRFSE